MNLLVEFAEQLFFATIFGFVWDIPKWGKPIFLGMLVIAVVAISYYPMALTSTFAVPASLTITKILASIGGLWFGAATRKEIWREWGK